MHINLQRFHMSWTEWTRWRWVLVLYNRLETVKVIVIYHWGRGFACFQYLKFLHRNVTFDIFNDWLSCSIVLWQATIALSNGNLLSIFLHPIALLRVGRQILIKTLSVFGHSLSQQRSSGVYIQNNYLTNIRVLRICLIYK